jgi:thiamine biosynthesis lipoprotein
MGCEVVVGGATRLEACAIDALFAERDGVFSRFRADSELNAVNAADVPVLVSAQFASALEVALEAAAATEGLVDPTLGSAVVAAGYDRDFAELNKETEQPPPRSDFRGCWTSIRLTGRLLTRPPHVQLDLNGVVKALTVDEALACLAGPGFVSAGGDLAARGPVDVALPGGDVVRLLVGGIATSGTVRRRWSRAGLDQHHLVDPHTGLPSRSPWSQVTVVGASCLAADVCAKAAFLLGREGPEWLDSHGVPGRFLSHDRVVLNDAWRAALTREHACT